PARARDLTNLAADEASRQFQLEREVGHPVELWDRLKERIQRDGVKSFGAIQDQWLALMWSLDAYRIASVPPRAMGRQSVGSQDRLGAINRSKGNWFSELVAALLRNRTGQTVGARARVA